MKRRLTVHVGLAKAGSTSIQHLLATRWRALSDFGIHVPGIGSSARLGSHHRLVQASTIGDRHEPWAQLAKQIRNADAERFVISSEAFASPNNREPCVARLLELAERENLEIEVIAYVRPQWQRLESGYAQSVKRGQTAQRFEDFTADALSMSSRAWRVRLDYNQSFAPFRTAFGDRVRVFALERSRLPQGLLVHFLEILGVHDGLNVAELARANARPGAKALEARRVVRQRVGSRYLSDGVLLSRRIAWLPSLFVDDAPFAGFGLEEIRRIEALFGAANALRTGLRDRQGRRSVPGSRRPASAPEPGLLADPAAGGTVAGPPVRARPDRHRPRSRSSRREHPLAGANAYGGPFVASRRGTTRTVAAICRLPQCPDGCVLAAAADAGPGRIVAVRATRAAGSSATGTRSDPRLRTGAPCRSKSSPRPGRSVAEPVRVGPD